MAWPCVACVIEHNGYFSIIPKGTSVPSTVPSTSRKFSPHNPRLPRAYSITQDSFVSPLSSTSACSSHSTNCDKLSDGIVAILMNWEQDGHSTAGQ